MTIEPIDDHFFRHQYADIVASLTRKVGVQHLALVEDAAQSSLMKAYELWREQTPPNPGAWLHRVAYNQVIDELRKQQGHISNETTLDDDSDFLTGAHIETQDLHLHGDDDFLHLILICCDPAIPQKSALVMVLKVLCGFSIKEIALRLFITEANAYKRYQRARDVLQEQANYFNLMSKQDSEERVESVLNVLYAIFSEGYLSYSKDESIRKELCDEALRIAEILARKTIVRRPRVMALISLMLFNLGRIHSRTDAAGQLLLLEEQDRANWNRGLIGKAFHYLEASSEGEIISRYHLEAAIAAEHCRARNFEATEWANICRYYQQLEVIHPSYLYRLNRVVALAEWQGAESALVLLTENPPPTWMAQSYLWSAVAADLHRRCNDFKQAQHYADLALKCAPTESIRLLLKRRFSHL